MARRWFAAITVGIVATQGAVAVGAADVVLDINELALRSALAARDSPGAQTRTLAIVHLAVFDAANAGERRYASYVAHSPKPTGTAPDTAALAAGCAALSALYPAQQPAIETACNSVAAALPDAAPDGPSRRYGAEVGRAVVESRASDGFGATNDYRPVTAPGAYIPTVLPIGYDTRAMRPYALASPAQFRPAPPPALASATWARDYDEVRTFGARTGSRRTPEQTSVATFWAPSGPIAFNPLLRQAIVGAGPRLADRARFMALAMMAAADASIAVFDAKYAYNFWRPLTAIRNGDVDGNDTTGRDAGWLPLIDAPMHPEYPCAHCISAAAVAEVMGEALGRGELASPLTMAAPGAPAATASVRSWTRVADIVTEVSNSRVWAGIHFRHSTEVGMTMGRDVGRHVIATRLRPVAAR